MEMESTSDLSAAMNFLAAPQTYLVNHSGNQINLISYRYVGVISYAKL